MIPLLKMLADWIDALSAAIGSAVRWLTLLTVLVCLTVALLRYLFSIGFVWMQDLYVWSHAVTVMLAAGYTYLINGHVRVDVFHGRFSERRKAIVEIAGVLLLLFPWLGLLAYVSLPYVATSWRIAEGSQQYGGLPGLFLLKTTLLVFAATLFLQGLSVVLRNVLFLAGHGGGPAPPARAAATREGEV